MRPLVPSCHPARLAQAVCVALIATAVPAYAAEPTGEWLVEKGYARIKVVNCNNRLWGVVAWEHRPDVDRSNPNPRLRNRPTLGMPILLGMRQVERNRWEGEIYNSQDGRTYSSNISLQGANVLRVQGCVLGFLCGGQNWTRVKADDSYAAASPTDRSSPAHASTDANRPGGQTATRTRPAAAPQDDICSRL
jgi:uncharacterized protein (DUF2147 family)